MVLFPSKMEDFVATGVDRAREAKRELRAAQRVDDGSYWLLASVLGIVTVFVGTLWALGALAVSMPA